MYTSSNNDRSAYVNSRERCIDFDEVLKMQAPLRDLAAEVYSLAQLQHVNIADRLEARKRSHGAVWHLSDFDAEVLRRQLADGVPILQAENFPSTLHRHCYFWDRS